MRSGSRRSFRHAASRDAMPSRLSTPRSSSTPTSDDSIPPSNATLTFLRPTAGSSKGRSVSCSMTGVALLDRSRETASTTESCDESRLSATSVAQNIGASRIGTANPYATVYIQYLDANGFFGEDLAFQIPQDCRTESGQNKTYNIQMSDPY